MKKLILSTLLLSYFDFSHAANFRIDTLKEEHTLYLDCESCSHPKVNYYIPQIKSDNPESSEIEKKVNNVIKEEIFWDNDNEAFTSFCHGVDFNYKMEGNYLLIDLDYVGYGAHGEVDNSTTFLFDLRTGEQVRFNEGSGINVPFASLFTLDGYFEFLKAMKWDEGVFEAFAEEYKNYLVSKNDADSTKADVIAFGHAKYSQFHIYYSVNDDQFNFGREWNYYADFCHALRCFEPGYSAECSIKKLKPYLNEIGKIVIDNKKSRVQKIVESSNLSHTTDNRLFFEISHYECPKPIEDEKNTDEYDENIHCIYVPYKVAIDRSDPDNIKGFLFIGNKKEKITGYVKDDHTYLKSKKSDWTFSFSESDLENVFWNKEKVGGSEGIIVGFNKSDDPY